MEDDGRGAYRAKTVIDLNPPSLSRGVLLMSALFNSAPTVTSQIALFKSPPECTTARTHGSEEKKEKKRNGMKRDALP